MTELKIRIYRDPAPKYKATDDVYVQVALVGSSYFQHVKGQIIRVVHTERPDVNGGDYWEVFVVIPVDPDDLVGSQSAQLVHVSHEPWLLMIRRLQENEAQMKQKFANIEEGYRRAIKAMMEKK
jgi:hypothetical protein